MTPAIIRSTFTSSALALLAANLIPLFGILYWDWSAIDIIWLFWMENLVIGIFNLLRILASQGDPYSGPAALATKIVVALLFGFVYSLFTAVHGIAITVIFSGTFESLFNIQVASIWHAILDNHLQWMIIPIVLSHAFSFFDNYIGKGEYRSTRLFQAMNAPFNRIFVLQAALLLSGYFAMSMGDSRSGVIAMLMLKIVMDLRSHVLEHRRVESQVVD